MRVYIMEGRDFSKKEKRAWLMNEIEKNLKKKNYIIEETMLL